MHCLRRVALLKYTVFATALWGQTQPNAKTSAPLQQFQENIDAYLKLRKMVADELPKLATTPSATDLAGRTKLLAANLARARAGARQGAIFTPPTAVEFRKLGKLAMGGGDGVRVRESLKNAEPVQGHVEVNQIYPSSVPLQSMPPTLLMNLPKLPMELQYSLVGKTLVLRDSEAGLIVDFLPEAIP
jgi:hypothetical protein